MKPVAKWVGGALAVALLFFLYQRVGEWRDGLMVKWKAEAKEAADTTIARALRSAKLDTVYLRSSTGYKAYRGSVLTSPTATARDTVTFAKCDEVQSACDARHAADSLEKVGLRDELRIERNKPSEKPRRFILYGEGMYDLLNAAPVFRAGVELRLLGGISATAAGDLAIPPAGQSRVQTRALVGIRYVF